VARHDIAFKIAALEPPIRLTVGQARISVPIPNRGTSMQHPAIIKHDRVALAQLMSVYSIGRLDERGEVPERVVKLVRRVAREGPLEWWAVAHRGDARLYATSASVGWHRGI